MNSNTSNIWPDPLGPDAQAFQKSLDLLLDEAEAYPLSEDRIAAIVDKANLIVRQASSQADAYIEEEHNPSSAIQFVQTPESQSDLNEALDEAIPLLLEEERVLRIVQKVQKSMNIEQDGNESNILSDQVTNATSASQGAFAQIKAFEPTIVCEESTTYQFTLWVKRHRASAAVAAVMAVLFPLLSVMWLTHELPIILDADGARHNQATFDRLRGGNGHSQSTTVMLDGTTSYPQAYGWLVWDEAIERWRFYAAGLKAASRASVYRIWLHRVSSNENTSIDIEKSYRPDPSVTVGHKVIEQTQVLAVVDFEVQDPTEPIDLLLDLEVPTQTRKVFGQYWISVTHEPKPGGPQPAGTIVMVGKINSITSRSGDDPG